MSPSSLAAFERLIRSIDHGPPLAERPPPTAENWKGVREGFARLAQQHAGHKYRFGDRLTYADLVIAGFLVTLRNCFTGEQLVEINAWDDGRWGSLIHEVESAGYTATDHGEVYAPSV
jgi:glutathione S-transferase